jgi:hypothetical protein
MNYNVSLGQPAAQTMPEQTIRLFPGFQPGCAPTVFPQFNINSNDQNTISLYNLLNSQHQGQSAYMSGIQTAGAYKVRLYAFDGCSVAFNDVTVTMSCPALTIPQPASNLGLKSGSASPYIMYHDTQAPALATAVQIKIPVDVTINYD